MCASMYSKIVVVSFHLSSHHRCHPFTVLFKPEASIFPIQTSGVALRDRNEHGRACVQRPEKKEGTRKGRRWSARGDA